MCGRITFTFSQGELQGYLKEQYHIDTVTESFDLPRYNVAPGQSLISVINDGKNNRVGLLKWGFIPSFSKDEKIGFKMINAKAETLFEKPAYREAAMTRRCVILADSFYEWDQSKQPYRIFTKGQKIFPLAGVFNTYRRANNDLVHTVAIITTVANKPMGVIHERMPVILDEESQRIWLDPKTKDIAMLKKVLKPYRDDGIDMYPVSKHVNSPTHDDELCIEKEDIVDLFSDFDEDESL